ncbi:MAG: hypothetical protein L0H73_14930 [Nitrococcus sp.]|nr:hypothetical protein [Nitrococcus sp.]
MMTIAEVPEFIRRAEKLLSEQERANLSKAERNELSKLVQVLVRAWIKR